MPSVCQPVEIIDAAINLAVNGVSRAYSSRWKSKNMNVMPFLSINILLQSITKLVCDKPTNHNHNNKIYRSYWSALHVYSRLSTQPSLDSYHANVPSNHWPRYFSMCTRVKVTRTVGRESVVRMAGKNTVARPNRNWTIYPLGDN